jgi:hypothetical protein
LRRLSEALVRTQYILSAPLGSIAILVLTLAPFAPGTAWSSWPLLAFLAYLLAWRSNTTLGTTAIEHPTWWAPWH